MWKQRTKVRAVFHIILHYISHIAVSMKYRCIIILMKHLTRKNCKSLFSISYRYLFQVWCSEMATYFSCTKDFFRTVTLVKSLSHIHVYEKTTNKNESCISHYSTLYFAYCGVNEISMYNNSNEPSHTQKLQIFATLDILQYNYSFNFDDFKF